MKFKLLSIVLIISSVAYGQFTYQGPAEGSIPTGYVLSTDTAPSASARPAVREKYILHYNPDAKIESGRKADLSKLGANYFSLDNSNSLQKSAADEVVVFKSIAGISDNGYIPPDPTVAVGPDHVIIMVNTEFQILDKKGNVLASIEASSWYDPVFQTESIADPKVIYDQFAERWVLVWIDIHDSSSEAYFIVSVSDDSDPLGEWFTWWLPTHQEGTTPSGKWGDYPGIGYDDKALYLTSNQFNFGGGGDYALIRIVPKTQVYLTSDTPGEVTWTDFWDFSYPGTNNTGWGVRPVHSYVAESDYYLVATPFWDGVHSTVAVYRIKNPVTAPELEAFAVETFPYETPGETEQLGGGEFPLEHNEVRLCKEPVLIDGIIYLTHSAKFNDAIGFRYLTIDTFSEGAFTDYVFGTDMHDHIYPAVAANPDGDAVITYTRSSADEYAGAYFTVIDGASEEPIGTFTMQEGLDNYVKDYGTNRNRWGDYMGAYLDPTDDYTFWVYSQFVERKNQWGTWLTGLRTVPFEQAYIKADITSFDFGIIEVSDNSETQTLKLANIGNEDLVISGLTFGTENFEIASDITLPYTVPKLDTLSIEIMFTPKEHGTLSDVLTITSNSTLSQDNQIALQGEGFIITTVSQDVMYASTGRGAGSLGSILTIDPVTGEGTALGEPSGFKPLKSISINSADNKLYALNTVLGQLPVIIILRADDGKGYEYFQTELDLELMTFDESGMLLGITGDSEYYMMNLDTKEATLLGQVPIDISAMTYNPITNEVFVTSSDSDFRDRLYKLTATGDTVFVGTMGLDKTFEALTFDNSGTLYGVVGRETQISTFYSIDPQAGESMELGSVDFRGVLGLTFAFDPAVNVDDVESEIPTDFALAQNYPNPFNPSTKINFSLPVSGNVKLTIYNLLGEVVEELLNGNLPAGYHTYNWTANGSKYSSGVYVYTIKAEGSDGRQFNSSKKMILLK